MFNDTAATEIYTLSLHAALPIYLDGLALSLRLDELAAHHNGAAGRDVQHFALVVGQRRVGHGLDGVEARPVGHGQERQDRKSTRLNSSHANISYAGFCLKTNNMS